MDLGKVKFLIWWPVFGIFFYFRYYPANSDIKGIIEAPD